MANHDTDLWKAIGTTPIRPDAQAGAPVRDDPIYERLTGETNKLESLAGGAKINWEEVVSLSTLILKEKSKDILVAAFLCVGLTEEKGYIGLLQGCACLEGIIASFWPILYPDVKRMRARVNAIIWLSEKGANSVARLPYNDRPLITDCINQIVLLDKLLSEKSGEPGLGILRRALEEQLQKSTETPPPEASVSSNQKEKDAIHPSLAGVAPLAVVARLAGVAPSPTQINSESDAEQVLREASDQMRKAALFARDINPSSPWPYRVVRSLTWLKIDALPSHNDTLETNISPPSPHLPEHYQNLIQQGAWKELLTQSESQMTQSLFWLDLQYFSDLALSHLGSSMPSARQAVTDEMITLMRRVPKLPELLFSDGTPFASEETRNWIDTLSAGSASLPDMTVSRGPKEPQNDLVDTVQKKMTDLFRQGQIKEAISLLQEEITVCNSMQKRFLLRLIFAKACIDTKIKEVRILKIAQSQLELLDQEKLSLETWEPKLCLDFLQTFWHILNSVYKETKQPEIKGQVETVYQRIGQIDPLCLYQLTEYGKKWI